MTASAAEQLDLWGTVEAVTSRYEPGVGRVLFTPNESWRARWTGVRYGWQIDRRITWSEPHRYWTGFEESEIRWEERTAWEGWEPDLPYGVEHILDRDAAVAALTALVDRHGDDHGWLETARRRRLHAVPA